MTTFQALQELENFYDKMFPAQEKSQETFAWFSGVPHPLFNAIMHLSSDKNLESKIEELIALAPIGTPLSFWVRNQDELAILLKKKGFQPIVTCPLMSWNVNPITAPIHRIQIADLKTFHNISATVFHFDPIVKEKFAKLLSNIEAENYLIYHNNQPIGTGTLIPNKTTGGIFNVAILPEYQKKGYGRAMMQFLMNRASNLGLEKLVLLSSPTSEKLYSGLEFAKLCDIEIYVR